MTNPTGILDLAYELAHSRLNKPFVDSEELVRRVEFVSRCLQNRAGVRLLLSCLLAKVHKPTIDVRKPYTEIGTEDCYSGRTYDEHYITSFINKYKLPCNPTTAFLTPALRNRNIVLETNVDLVGRPPLLYQRVLELLDNVYTGEVSAKDLLHETIRQLIILGEERKQRIGTLLKELKESADLVPLSAESIVTLIGQHLKCKGSSRLPVLIVAAAYHAAAEHLKEKVLPLYAHTAANEQTGALGDIQITIVDDDKVVTSYEMKARRVTKDDIDRAIQKIDQINYRIDNYIFITTDTIDEAIQDYAKSIYDSTGGIEMVILDCISFIRHFLHLFHRIRMKYIESYQELLLEEPDSAVSQPLKEAFLALRQAAESTENLPSQYGSNSVPS